MAPREEERSSDIVTYMPEGGPTMTQDKLSIWCEPPDSKDVPPSSLVAEVWKSGTMFSEEQFSLYDTPIQCSFDQNGEQRFCAKSMRSQQVATLDIIPPYRGQVIADYGTSEKEAAYLRMDYGGRKPSRDVVPFTGACNEWQVGGPWNEAVISTKPRHGHKQMDSFPLQMPRGPLSVALPQDEPGDGLRTTLMIRNIPSPYTPETLLLEWPNNGTYDFFYLPFNSRLQRNLMYVFINFTSPEAALEFKHHWQKTRLASYTCQKPLNIGFADVQGRDENLRQLKKKRLLHTKNKMCQPLVFRNGLRVPLDSALTDLDTREMICGMQPQTP